MKERRREKEEERKQDGTCTPGREVKVRQCSRIWGTPLTSGEISWDRRGASGARRRAQQPVCGRADRVRPTQMVCAMPCAPQPEMGVCQCTWGLGAAT